MNEEWRDIAGYEGFYQVSDHGRVKSLPFLQRYVLRNGAEGYRRTREHLMATQIGRHGYELVCLCRDNARVGRSVHSLVADAFLDGSGETVNHKDGVKSNNHLSNLEWTSYSENHNHAVDLGLNTQAIAVRSPRTGRVYPSMARAMREEHVSRRTVCAYFTPVGLTCTQ
jgi:hypothetical protein